MQTRTVVAGDTVFLVRSTGEGDGVPLLLLHGVPETSSCWRDLAPLLAEGRRVLVPDLPGLGGSTFSGPYDVGTLVGQLSALLDAEGVGEQVDVVGHDWGGVLALGLAETGRVRRLVVANAPYRSVPLPRAAHVPFFALPLLPDLAFRVGRGRLVGLMLRLGWKADVPLDEERREEYTAAYTGAEKVGAMLGYYRAAVRGQLRRPEPGPPAHAERMLVLWGARDPVLPISSGEAVVRALGPDCRLVTVPGAGHFVLEEAHDVVAGVLQDELALP